MTSKRIGSYRTTPSRTKALATPTATNTRIAWSSPWESGQAAARATRLLMIEPTTPAHAPIEDEYTAAARIVMERVAVRGLHRFRGVHECTCGCGLRSDNTDYFVAPDVITSSLMAEYVARHRSACDPRDLQLILELARMSPSPTARPATTTREHPPDNTGARQLAAGDAPRAGADRRKGAT